MFQCPGRKEPALSVLNKSNQIQYMGTALLFILLRKMTNCQNPKGDTRPMPCPTWGISGQLSRPQPRRGGWFMDLYLCQIIGTSANVFLIFWAIPAQTACDGFRCIIHILHIYIYIYNVGHFWTETAEKNMKHGNNVHKPSKHKRRSLPKS